MTRRLSIVLLILFVLCVTVVQADNQLTGTQIGDKGQVWFGLDLGSPHVITKVGWMPSVDGQVASRVVLGVFEGANRPDFMDALPLYLIEEKSKNSRMTYGDVKCSRGFRYVRFVRPADASQNVAELEFYGYQGEGDDSQFYQITNLPTVSIHTLNDEIPYDKEHEIVSQLTIISENGAKLLSEPGYVRERGNYSRTFDKKPYRIKFEEKQHVLDAPAKAKKWTLINNYGDKTLMRNLLAFELSRRLGMPYTPYGTVVDVLLNGEYKGCYQLCDQIQVHKDRVNITEMTTHDNEGSALTGGYFIEIDAYANQEKSWFKSVNGNPVTIKSPRWRAIRIVISTRTRSCAISWWGNYLVIPIPIGVSICISSEMTTRCIPDPYGISIWPSITISALILFAVRVTTSIVAGAVVQEI